MPLRLRHGYAAAFHRGLPAGDITQPRSSLRECGAMHRDPAHIRQVGAGG